MSSALSLLQLFAHEGPNIFRPDPGVLLRVTCERDRSARIRAALKDGAQFAGLMLAFLETEARPTSTGFVVSASFATDTPELGAALAAYVVEGINAELAGDTEWDRDSPLLALQARRRTEAPPVAALQLIAEARQRGLPVFRGPDGNIRFGYGAFGWGFDPATLGVRGDELAPPWERLGTVPLIVITGATGRGAAVERFAAEIAEYGPQVATLDDASPEAVRRLLADPTTEAAVIGFDAGTILRHGVPFPSCTTAVITDRDGSRPPEAANDEEWLRALGVPMLLADQPAHIELADPHLQPLVAYAPGGVIGL